MKMKSEFLIVVVSVACSILFGDVECNGSNNGVDPCGAGNHTALESSDRLHSIHQNNHVCDDNLIEGWYKFEVNGRPAEIPHLCLKNNVCGTQLPMRIDLAGKAMPGVNETVDAHVCTSYDVLGKWDCCVLRQPIKIKTCAADIYVYYLKPTDRCNVAYCVQEVNDSPSQNLTIKRGDDSRFRGSSTSIPITYTTTASQNDRNSSTTEVPISATSTNTSEVTSESVTNIPENDTTRLTVTIAGITTANDENISVTTVTAPVNVSVTENGTIDDGSSTTLAGLSPGNTDKAVNMNDTTAVNMNVTTTDLPPPLTNASRRLNTSTESSVSDVGVTTTENVPNNSVSMTTSSSTIENTSTNDTPTNQTTSNIGTSTAVPGLPCENWTKTLCKDGNTTCYLSPTDNTSYRVCADRSGCGVICDNVPDCNDGSDESQHLCPTTTTTSITNATFSSTDNSQNVTEEIENSTSQTFAQSTRHVTVTTENGSHRMDNVTAYSDPTTNSDPTTTETSFLSTADTSQDLSTVSASNNISDTTESITARSNTTSGMINSSESVNQTRIVPEPSVTDSAITNNQSTTEAPTDQEVTESNLVTTVSSVQNHTSQDELSTDGSVRTVSPTLNQTVTSTQTSVTSESLTTSEKEHEPSSQGSSSSSVESTIESTTGLSPNTSMQSSSQTERHTSTDINTVVTTVSSSVTIMSSGPGVSNGTTIQEPVQSPSGITDSAPVSSSGDVEVTTPEQTTLTYQRSDGQQSSSSFHTTSSANVKTGTSATVESTLSGITSMSPKISVVTGSGSTSAGGNKAMDQTTHVQDEKTGLYYENFGLFVFLIVAGVVIAGTCMFGIIGYMYQRRFRTWNPSMAYQDAYGDFEKKPLPFGREKFGVESPIPDFDILRDEKKFEETSLSQASTLAVGPTPGRSAGPPFDDSYDEIQPDGMTNGKPNGGACQHEPEVSYITDGQTTDSFPAYENGDGVVPVDEIDNSSPRTLFPWIENAADTKL
ncbi:mucin-5AC-like isoform X2 [Ruditapes philippinarum]|uniref:mucin-5AC-like isoform X2 n=1 Tax=Ruditapes philippinarum TaxID=129788 RepID=UPI00295B9493|nr:mucin-5AC-like isoform X2 [Ruditapes philippinarum]